MSEEPWKDEPSEFCGVGKDKSVARLIPSQKATIFGTREKAGRTLVQALGETNERAHWYNLLMKVVHSFSWIRYGMFVGSDAALMSSACGEDSYACDDWASGGGFM